MAVSADQPGSGKGARYNPEGYADPTAYEATRRAEREMREARRIDERESRPLVYICSPYAGDVLNNECKARRYCQYAIRKQAIPVASHLLYPQLLDDRIPEDRALGMYFGLALLGKCEECWVFGKTVSPGMAKEIERAKQLGLKTRYFTEDIEEVRRP